MRTIPNHARSWAVPDTSSCIPPRTWSTARSSRRTASDRTEGPCADRLSTVIRRRRSSTHPASHLQSHHHRHSITMSILYADTNATQLSSCVASLSRVCTEFATSCDDTTADGSVHQCRRVSNYMFLVPKCLETLCLVRVRSVR